MAAVVLGVLLSLTGCGSEEDPAHEVRTGQIEEVPAKAVAGDRQVEIGLPTGVLKVKLNAGRTRRRPLPVTLPQATGYLGRTGMVIRSPSEL